MEAVSDSWTIAIALIGVAFSLGLAVNMRRVRQMQEAGTRRQGVGWKFVAGQAAILVPLLLLSVYLQSTGREELGRLALLLGMPVILVGLRRMQRRANGDDD